MSQILEVNGFKSSGYKAALSVSARLIIGTNYSASFIAALHPLEILLIFDRILVVLEITDERSFCRDFS